MTCTNPLDQKKRKILFLDIDGVINSTRTAVASGIGYPHDLESMHLFDPVALSLIRKLCRQGDISVVLSSTWRMHFPYHEVANALDLPIIGATDTQGRLRGEEIQRWLDANKDLVECYAIVDDDSDMLKSQFPRFCHTDSNEGLMWKDYLKLCSLFGIKDPFGNISAPTRGE